MENRSFDHMLGALEGDRRTHRRASTARNPTPTRPARTAPAQPLAEYQGQLDPDPDHHFPGVDLQIFNGDTTPTRVATMQGFVKSYFAQRKDVKHSRKIMYYFTPDKLPVLTTLATEFAVFNRWFSSIPGPTLCNRAFAHYGTSFGHVGMEVFYPNTQFKSIYQRLDDAPARRRRSTTSTRRARRSKSSTCCSISRSSSGRSSSSSTIAARARCPTTRSSSRTTAITTARRRRRPRLRSASGPSRAGRRAVHRGGLQRDPAERRALGIDRAADRLRRARRHLRSRAAARVHCRTGSSRSPTRPAPASRSCSIVSAFACRRFSSRRGWREAPSSAPIACSSTRRIPATATRFFLGRLRRPLAAREGGGNVSRPADTQHHAHRCA